MIRTIVWGMVVVAVGTWLWLANLGVLSSGIVPRRDWPVIVVVVGLLVLAEGVTRLIRRRGR